MRTFSSPAGYQIQVPADWQGAAPSAQNSNLELSSADDRQTLFVESFGALAPGKTALDTCNVVNTLLGRLFTDGRSSPAQSTNVTGADSAASCAFDAAAGLLGPTHIQHLIAVRGRQQYHVGLWMTPAFFAANRGLVDQILASFQLTTPTP